MRIASVAIIAAAASLLAVGLADAKPRRAPNEVTVTGRSYLDAGTKMKPGGYPGNYLYLSQGSLSVPQSWYQASFYGQETLPRRFEPGYTR